MKTFTNNIIYYYASLFHVEMLVSFWCRVLYRTDSVIVVQNDVEETSNRVMRECESCNKWISYVSWITSSLYYGLPKYLLRIHRFLMNRAARLITCLSSRERITPSLIELHWPSVRACTVYKLSVRTYEAIHSDEMKYIRSLLQDFSWDTTISLRHDM